MFTVNYVYQANRTVHLRVDNGTLVVNKGDQVEIVEENGDETFLRRLGALDAFIRSVSTDQLRSYSNSFLELGA